MGIANESEVPRHEPVRLLAANVVARRRCGAGGQELRPGTKCFRGGAKAYVADAYRGPGGDRVTVVGRARHTGLWVVIDTATRHLHSFRPKLVHTPRVLELLGRARRARGFGPADRAAEVSATLERYARHYRAATAPRSPHPDRCLCHGCLTGEPSRGTSALGPGVPTS